MAVAGYWASVLSSIAVAYHLLLIISFSVLDIYNSEQTMSLSSFPWLSCTSVYIYGSRHSYGGCFLIPRLFRALCPSWVGKDPKEMNSDIFVHRTYLPMQV